MTCVPGGAGEAELSRKGETPGQKPELEIELDTCGGGGAAEHSWPGHGWDREKDHLESTWRALGLLGWLLPPASLFPRSRAAIVRPGLWPQAL